jgi:Fe2+ or Zn2+ uptake regulation protein
MKKLPFERFREKGLYITPFLKKTVTVLSKSRAPLSVAELCSRITEKGKHPLKPTMYRLMTKLAETGLVQEGLFSDEIRRYTLTPEGEHYHHFFCQRCGYAERLPSNICKQVENLARALKSRGNEIFTHTVELEGLCAKCAQKPSYFVAQETSRS